MENLAGGHPQLDGLLEATLGACHYSSFPFVSSSQLLYTQVDRELCRSNEDL